MGSRSSGPSLDRPRCGSIVEAITVDPARRTVREVEALAESISTLGLLNPITVTLDGSDRYRLVAGRHRLEACRSLGWTEIQAVVVRLDDLHAELAMIDENLVRRELTVMERGEQLRRRKEIYEAIHPEVKHGGDRRSSEAVSISSGNDCHLKRFTEDTAEKVGVSERTIRGDVQIAERIPAALREKIRDTPLADRKTDLLELARLEPDQQERIVERILASADPLSVKEALSLDHEESKDEDKPTMNGRRPASKPERTPESENDEMPQYDSDFEDDGRPEGGVATATPPVRTKKKSNGAAKSDQANYGEEFVKRANEWSTFLISVKRRGGILYLTAGWSEARLDRTAIYFNTMAREFARLSGQLKERHRDA